MAIPNNTSIALGASSPKKDAVVASPGIAAAAGEVRIWAASGCPENKTQFLVGQWQKMFDTIKGNMNVIEASVATPVIVSMPFDGEISEMVVDGTPTADDLRIEIGQDISAGAKSHFLKRTFDRLIERWLEESK